MRTRIPLGLAALLLSVGALACDGGAEEAPEPDDALPMDEPDAGDAPEDPDLEGSGGQQEDFDAGSNDDAGAGAGDR